MLKKYEFGFEMWGLLLFLILMAPNFIWFAIPALNDVLRVESVTPYADIIGSVFQFVMIAALCFMRYKGEKLSNMTVYIMAVAMCIVCYFTAWIMYYSGNVSTLVIVLLTFAPCLAFVLFSIAKRNVIAIVSALGFAVCHIIYAVVNFL